MPTERHGGVDHTLVDVGDGLPRLDGRRDAVAGNAAEHGRVGDPVAAQAVGAVHAAGIFAGRIQARHLGRAVGLEHQAAHHIMRGRHHLDQAAD